MNIRAMNSNEIADIKVDTTALFGNSETQKASNDEGVSFTDTLSKAVKSLEASVQKLQTMVQSLSKASSSSLSGSNLAAQAMLSGLSSLSSLTSNSNSSSFSSNISSTYGMSSAYSIDMLKFQLQDIVGESAENALNSLGSADGTVNYGYGRNLSIIRSETTETKTLQKI